MGGEKITRQAELVMNKWGLTKNHLLAFRFAIK